MKKEIIASILVLLAAHTAVATDHSNDINEWEVERNIYQKVNQVRTDKGLAPLDYDHRLAETARAHSENMAQKDRMFHRDSLFGAYEEYHVHCGYEGYWMASENVAYLYQGDKDEIDIARDVVEMWMNSPGHRQNILDTHAEGLGIGVESAGDRMYFTQNFCG